MANRGASITAGRGFATLAGIKLHGLHAELSSMGLLWACKSLLDFLSELTVEQPDFLKLDRAISGFSDILCDSEQLLGLAIELLQAEGKI